MHDLLGFKAGYYMVTKLYPPDVIEVDDTYFIKLKGLVGKTKRSELKSWIKTDFCVRVVPHYRNDEARIVSDVWLGNVHINRQFPNYEKS